MFRILFDFYYANDISRNLFSSLSFKDSRTAATHLVSINRANYSIVLKRVINLDPYLANLKERGLKLFCSYCFYPENLDSQHNIHFYVYHNDNELVKNVTRERKDNFPNKR